MIKGEKCEKMNVIEPILLENASGEDFAKTKISELYTASHREPRQKKKNSEIFILSVGLPIYVE